jgi:hypothetical protein
MHYYAVYVHRGQVVEFNFAFVFMQTLLGSPLHTGADSGFLIKNCETQPLDSDTLTSFTINHIYHMATYFYLATITIQFVFSLLKDVHYINGYPRYLLYGFYLGINSYYSANKSLRLLMLENHKDLVIITCSN